MRGRRGGGGRCTVDGFAATLVQALERVGLVDFALLAVHKVVERLIGVVEFAEFAFVVEEQAGE